MFNATVMVYGMDFVCTSNGGCKNSPREARESAASQMLCKLRMWQDDGAYLLKLVAGSIGGGAAKKIWKHSFPRFNKAQHIASSSNDFTASCGCCSDFDKRKHDGEPK